MIIILTSTRPSTRQPAVVAINKSTSTSEPLILLVVSLLLISPRKKATNTHPQKMQQCHHTLGTLPYRLSSWTIQATITAKLFSVQWWRQMHHNWRCKKGTIYELRFSETRLIVSFCRKLSTVANIPFFFQMPACIHVDRFSFARDLWSSMTVLFTAVKWYVKTLRT